MNREKVREIKRRIKKDNKFFFSVINHHSLHSNRLETYKIYNAFIKDNNLYKKLREIYLPSSLRAYNSKSMIYNDNLSERDSIEWASFLIDLFSEELNIYLYYKEVYENLLFAEQYNEAHLILLKIESEVCNSLWLCGQKLMLEEQISGLEGNKKLLGKFVEQTKDNQIVNVLLEFYSYTSEKNMSYMNYQDKVKKFIESLQDQEAIENYFNFKINMDYIDNIDYKPILQIDSQLSIIDLYNSYLEMVQIKSFDYEYEEIEQLMTRSFRKLKDYRISNILNKYSNYELNLYSFDNQNFCNVNEIIEHYTKGDYNTSIEKLNFYLKSNSNDFQMILLLIKSHILGCKEFSSQYAIYQDIYNIYTINKSTNDSFTNLYGYLKLYSGTSWRYKISGFINRKIKFSDEDPVTYLSYLNDRVLTPSFTVNITNSNCRKEFLEIYKGYCPITTSLYSYMNGYLLELSTDLPLDPLRRRLYIATKKIGCGETDYAISLLTSQLKEINQNNYYMLERVTRKLLLAYKNSGLLTECVELIVESYFINENLIKRLELRNVVENIKRSDDAIIKKNIMYPILIYLYDKNDYKAQRIAYSNYMDYNQLNSVENIILINKNKNQNLLVFFLHKICVQHLIKRDIRLASSGLLADEVRTEILRQLIKLDSANRKIYYDEINAIMTKRGIRDRIKQINQSRVFVDVENIKVENKEILIENFNKYINVKRFEEEVTSIDITSEEYVDVIKSIVSEMNNRIKIDATYSQEIVILKGLLSRITEEFLYNEKYGLNTFLSSRIRHGYINSQLTNLFYYHNLMSKTANEGSGIYTINEYWDKLVAEETEDFMELKQYLSDFTNVIDKKVNEIKNEWIKIRYSSKDVGFLDFASFVQQCLIMNAENFVDFDVFFNTVIDLLWDHTNKLLSSLRKMIEIQLKSYLINSLNDLEMNMKKLENTNISHLVKDVNNNINLCKVKLETIIKEFTDVFYIRDIQYLDYSMDDLVATCLEISSKLYSNFNYTKLEKNIELPYNFKGKTFLYFVDILNILINNSLEHSGVEDFSNLTLDITIKDEDIQKLVDVVESFQEQNYQYNFKKLMSITVRNNLNGAKETEKIKRKVQEVFDNVKSPEILKKYTQTEGGSGLYKLYKTLQFNIFAPYTILYDVTSEYFEISILIGLDTLIIGEEGV